MAWPRRALACQASRLLALVLALVVLLGGAGEGAAGVVTTVDLNLRAGHGLAYVVLMVIPAGAAVAVRDGPVAGWYPVRYQDLESWAHGGGLGLATGSAPPTATAVVDVAGRNLRAGPGLDYAVLDVLPYGTPVELLAGADQVDGSAWRAVRVAGLGGGWVAEVYLGGVP